MLLMDEPTAAPGVPEQRKVLDLVKKVKAAGQAAVFISHNLMNIFEVADRILVLFRGSGSGERKISETTHDEVVRLMASGK